MSTRLIEHGNRRSAPAVPERVRAAAEILATTPGAPDYAAIAAKVGYRDAHMLRRALALPQSIRYLREHKRQVLEAINAFNPEALRKVRDESANGMAVVQAVRALEGLDDADDAMHRAPRQAAGITIVIETPGAGARVLNPAPVLEHEPDQHAWPSVD